MSHLVHLKHSQTGLLKDIYVSPYQTLTQLQDMADEAYGGHGNLAVYGLENPDLDGMILPDHDNRQILEYFPQLVLSDLLFEWTPVFGRRYTAFGPRHGHPDADVIMAGGARKRKSKRSGSKSSRSKKSVRGRRSRTPKRRAGGKKH